MLQELSEKWKLQGRWYNNVTLSGFWLWCYGRC